MKLSNIVIALEVFFHILLTGSVSETAEDYVTLISDVHKFSKTSPVYLMHFAEDDNLSLNYLIFNLRFLLSNKKISTSTVNLAKVFFLNQEIFFDFRKLRKDTRAMSVFLVKSKSDLTKMRNVLKFLSRDEIINLVLFLKTDEAQLEEFCMNPKGNPFFLNKGISLLVKCQDILIREWHSLDENQMRIYKRATWKPETGLILKSEKLVLSDLDVLNGKVLLSISAKQAGKTIAHYMESLFQALEAAGNFTIKEVESVAKFGRFDENTKTWTGALGYVIDKKADLIFSLFGLTADKIPIFDYSEVLINADMFLMIRQPRNKLLVSWSAFLQSFSAGVWIALLTSLIVVQTLRILSKSKSQNDIDEKFVINDFIYICGIYCQQGLPVFPRASSMRIFYSTIFLFTFCIFSIYSAGSFSKLSIVDSNLPFDSLEEMVRDKSHKIIVPSLELRGKLKDAKHFPWNKADELIEESLDTPENMMEMVCRNNVAMLASDLIFTDLFDGIKTCCPVVKIKIVYNDPLAIIFQKNGPYTRAMNHLIRKFRYDGTLKRLKIKLYDTKIDPVYSVNEPDNKYSAVSFLDLAVLSAIFSGGVVFSAILLFHEKLYFWLHQTRSVKNLTYTRPVAARSKKHKLKLIAHSESNSYETRHRLQYLE